MNTLKHSGKFKIDVEQETDGRWIAEVCEIPGVLAYGQTRHEAIRAVFSLAFRVLADEIERSQVPVKKELKLAFATAG